jgi:hypothetical protein
MPPNPKAPAMMAMMAKMIAHFSMTNPTVCCHPGRGSGARIFHHASGALRPVLTET